jgi:hypothetical protein
MSERPPQLASVTCPQCGHQFAAPIQNVIDVGRHPELKSMLLHGRLNVAACPQCGSGGMLNVPFIYHDPDKKLLLVLTPNNLNISGEAQQRLIGDLSNAVMSYIPPEQRKAYLLQPKVFLTLPTLLEAILQAEGVTPDMLEAQRVRARLVDEFLQASDDIALRGLAAKHDEDLDYDFFATLTASIDAAQARGQSALVERLLALRSKLLEVSSLGRSVQAQREALESLGDEVTHEELLEKVINAQDDSVLQVLISAVRPLVDYQFFRMLTDRIEAAGEQEAARLKELRSKILEITRELDAQAKKEFDRAASLLREVWLSEDQEQAIRAHLSEIDDLFLTVLAANIQSAQETGEVAAAEELTALMDLVFDILEENVPPQIRLINRLLRAEYPDGTRDMLKENIEQVNDDLLELMDVLVEDMEANERKEVSQRLGEIRQQAEELLA